MSFLRFTTKPNETLAIIISNGMLLPELNHNASVLAFNALASKYEQKIEWNKALPLVLAADAKVKMGGDTGFTKQQFILELRKIFALEKASDDEICEAWNAMLGDLSKLANTLAELKNRYPNNRIVLMSGTNPIHAEAVYFAVNHGKLDSEKQTNPLKLADVSWHVSFLQTVRDEKLRMTETNLIDELLKIEMLAPYNSLLLISLASLSPIPQQQEREEDWHKQKKPGHKIVVFMLLTLKKGLKLFLKRLIALLNHQLHHKKTFNQLAQCLN